MKTRALPAMLILLALLFTPKGFSADLPEGYPETGRKKHCINAGWKFHLGEPEAKYYLPDTDDSAWESVNVPHSLKLTSIDLDECQDDKSQETFHRDVGWYRKVISLRSGPDRKVFLEFEGAHQVTDLWVNGKHVGQHAVGGYTPFHFDITGYVTIGGDNQVTLLVDNRRREDVPPDPGPFDYIKFSGLYRDVYLVETDPLHITFNWEATDAGVYISTPSVDPLNMNATIQVRTAVRNESGETKNTTMLTRVIDADGIVVLKLMQKRTIQPGRTYVFDQIGSIEDDLRLWGINHPYLYRVNSLVLDGDEAVDCIENRTGFRKVELTRQDGFLLNGEPVKMIGTNRHQHYGYIGDALPNSLHYKDVLQIKEWGMNILRTAHYPQDDAILDACDELGILAYEEAPTWIDIGSDAWFDNLDAAARAMVRNHRNHPCLIIWGAGINHRGYVPRIHNAVKQEDPVRWTASQSSRWTGWQTSGLTDIYAQMVYGPYYWSEDEYMLAMEGGRGPEAVNHYLDHPMKLGLIAWTAHAYYTFHPSRDPKDRTRRIGFTDVFRDPEPRSTWFRAELKDESYIHIRDQWKQGIERLEVYSNTEEVELVLNDKAIAREFPSGEERYNNLKHPPFQFSIADYEDGELVARGISEGRVVISDTIRTPGKASALMLELDTTGRKFTADGSDILVAYARVVDRNGTIVSDTEHEITMTVDGPAAVVGEGKDIGSNPLNTRQGSAPFLIRAGDSEGSVGIRVKSKGLKSASAIVMTVSDNPDMIVKNARPIYDFGEIRVDIGEKDQLLQYEWIPWSGDDNLASLQEFSELGGFRAEIRAAENDSLLRWLGEINVMGKYAYAYGEGVICMDEGGMILEFAGLKEGSYRLTTYHHAPRSNTDSMDPNQETEVTANIFRLPFASLLGVGIADAGGSGKKASAPVTFGKEMHTDPFGSGTYVFTSNGRDPVRIVFSDAEGSKGVWLNAFRLSRWFPE